MSAVLTDGCYRFPGKSLKGFVEELVRLGPTGGDVCVFLGVDESKQPKLYLAVVPSGEAVSAGDPPLIYNEGKLCIPGMPWYPGCLG